MKCRIEGVNGLDSELTKMSNRIKGANETGKDCSISQFIEIHVSEETEEGGLKEQCVCFLFLLRRGESGSILS